MNIAQLSIEKKTITIVITVLLLFGGIKSYMGLGRLEDPEFTIKSAKVITYYPGATAMEVAEEVTDPLEISIQKMGQVRRVKSLSMPGFSSIEVEIKKHHMAPELPQIWDELRRKVGDVQDQLPPGTSTSLVWDDFGDVYGIFYAIYGDGYTEKDIYEYAKMLRRELLLVQDVADVSLFGVRDERIYLEMSRGRISQLGISPEMIYASLSGQNVVVPAGNIQVGRQYIRIFPTGELTSVEDIGDIALLAADGTTRLFIKDIATIRRGYVDPPKVIVRFNGMPAVGLGISTIEGGNVVVMGQAVSERLKELQAETPIGMEIGAISHQADTVVTSINSFVISLIEAIAIVVGVLVFAMGFRSGILIGVVLLLTVLSTFILMEMNGVMLERISLGALIIALGMLVDNAIVVVEGILINAQKGMSKKDGAIAIVKQTMWPLFGATVVAVLAFAAIGSSPDSTGEYCRSLYQVILYSLTLSWVLAITTTPLAGISFLRVKKLEGDKDPYGGMIFQTYKSLLVFCMRRRYFTIAVLVGLLALSMYGFGFVDKSFFPDSTRPQFMLHFWMPQGTHINDTETNIKSIEKYILQQEGVTDITSVVGQGAMRFLLTYTPEEPNPAYGLVLVSVEDYRAIDTLMERIQKHLNEEFPDAQIFCRRFMLGPGDANKIQVRLRGADPDILRELSVQVEQIMHDEPDAVDINTDWRQRVPLLRPIISETAARNAGLTRQQIALTLQTVTEGITVGQYREGDELIPIVFRSPESERDDVRELDNVQIYNPIARGFIPIRQVVTDIKTVSENQIIRRRNRLPTLTVRCDPKSGPASIVFERLKPKIDAIPIPQGYSLEWGGEYENSAEAQQGLSAKLPVIFLLMVLAVIILFNSIKKPLIIFLTVPLAIIGVTVGLLLMKQPFGFMALLGFLSLTGMLIKNSIVLIDEINMQIASGKNPFMAIVDSGVSRVRPVSMAAMTTVLGMIPLLTDAFFVAMAVTVMFGLAFATVLTLIVVPVLYAVFFRIKQTAA
ncbi:MAG: efflux RND transporter permease subunit [Planctomycetota bacterium]|jgi:multidrug efflux pump subunit AcrB